MIKLNAYEMNTIYDILIEEIDTLARRIINAPTKDIDWLGGYKNKTCIYAFYKRPTSDLESKTWTLRDGN